MANTDTNVAPTTTTPTSATAETTETTNTNIQNDSANTDTASEEKNQVVTQPKVAVNLDPQQVADLTGIPAMNFFTDAAWTNRQKVFNGKQSVNDVKITNGGKPLNNNDPYPVDQKIQELESHMPRIKKNSCGWVYEEGMSKDLLEIADYTEKRIVKLENILATVLRYVFATGTRFAVNCVYYGGQDHRSKYKCIRCLKDDRVNDGQVVQIDQCLSCSRYEPIIGQTYDVLNELGTNLAVINDDIQMGYMNMKDYVELLQVDQMHEQREKSLLNTNNLNRRLNTDTDHNWDAGIKMNWKLVPVENQKAQINWQQDINTPKSQRSTLQSNQVNNGHGGSGKDPGFTVQSGNNNSQMDAGSSAVQAQQAANGERKSGVE